jgi:hypothetical protein
MRARENSSWPSFRMARAAAVLAAQALRAIMVSEVRRVPHCQHGAILEPVRASLGQAPFQHLRFQIPSFRVSEDPSSGRSK